MKVLITGGAGFIGSNLARLMLREGIAEVRVLDDLSTGYLKNLENLDVSFTKGSILDYETVLQVATGVDSIIHLAAIGSVPRSVANPRASHEANTTGSLNVLEAAREADVPHVIVASSSAVYGANPKLPKNEEDWTRPLSPYGVSKHATEGYALAYQASYGLKTLAFRFFNVYGPHQSAGHAYAAVIPKFIEAALNNVALEIQGDGKQSRDFTYVETVCRVIVDAVKRQVTSTGPVNLAFNTNTDLLELITDLERLLRYTLDRHHVGPRAGDVRASQADALKIRQLFPDIAPVELVDGLEATLDWYKRERLACPTRESPEL